MHGSFRRRPRSVYNGKLQTFTPWIKRLHFKTRASITKAKRHQCHEPRAFGARGTDDTGPVLTLLDFFVPCFGAGPKQT